MKKYFLSVIVCSFLSIVAAAQNEDSLWVRDNYYKKEVMMPARDGAKLFTALYIPKDSSTKHPILFNRTPYSCAPYGENNFSPRLYSTYWINYLKEGYIIAIQDVRGRWMSEGDFVDVRPFNTNKKDKDIDEASDTYDAIEWMINNVPANNKRVGVFGISYPGFYSTMAALSNHPALKAVSPQAPVTEWFFGRRLSSQRRFYVNGRFWFLQWFWQAKAKAYNRWQSGF